jgi:hypothetical protein
MLEIQGSYRPGTESEEMKQLKAKLPYSLRFITATVKGMRPKKWFAENFKKLNRPVMPLVVEPFNDPRVKAGIERGRTPRA